MTLRLLQPTLGSVTGLAPVEHLHKTEISGIVNEKISVLVSDFMNFNALKFILKIHKKIIKKDPSHKGIYLGPSTYMQDMREIPAIVNEQIVIKF